MLKSLLPVTPGTGRNGVTRHRSVTVREAPELPLGSQPSAPQVQQQESHFEDQTLVTPGHRIHQGTPGLTLGIAASWITRKAR